MYTATLDYTHWYNSVSCGQIGASPLSYSLAHLLPPSPPAARTVIITSTTSLNSGLSL